MMKKILGNIILIALVFVNLNAGVKASLSAPAIYKGDSVSLAITANGDDIEFPDIDKIGPYNIEGTSSSQSTTIINGNISKEVSKVYRFTPKKSVTIPSYKVTVDGKVYRTKKLKLEVLKPSANGQGADFILQMSVDKKVAHVGEAINLTLSLKQKLDAKAHDIRLGEPKLENFWIKKEDGVKKESEGEYVVQKIHYILFPQKSGHYTLEPVEGAVGKVVQTRSRGMGGMFDDPFFNDPFFNSLTNRIKWTKIFSNEIELDIKPLPNNMELYGNFKIEASVDKKEVYANKPLNLTVKVTGEGNIDDIKKFEPQIENAVVYADEPKIDSFIQNGKYGGEFTQKIAIIADSNYTIDPIELKFFDKESNKTKVVKTQPIKIVVKGGTNSKKHSTKIESANLQPLVTQKNIQQTETKNEPNHIKYIFLLVGMLLGSALTYLFGVIKNRGKKSESDMIKKIKKTKNDRELFDLLLPYSQKDRLISDTLNKLEENLYKKATHKIDKNELMDFFEDEIGD